MGRTTLALDVVLSVSCAALFLLNYARPPGGKPRHPGSLAAAFLAIGWALAAGIKLRWVGLELEVGLFSMALVMLSLSVAIVAYSRSQK